MRKFLFFIALILLFNACAGVRVKPEAQKEFEQGLTLFDRGQYEKAMPHFEKSAELDPDFAKAHLYLGRSHLSQGQWLEAVPPLRAAHRLSPDDSKKEVLNILVDAVLGAALSELKAGDFKGSVNFFKEAMELKPDSIKGKAEFVPAFLGLGGELLSKGETGEAIKTYNEAVALFPESLKIYVELAKALFKGGNLNKALDVLKDALKIDSSSWEIRSLMLLLQGGQMLR
jgi:tetratricopeptide (TPR) repeat protein